MVRAFTAAITSPGRLFAHIGGGSHHVASRTALYRFRRLSAVATSVALLVAGFTFVIAQPASAGAGLTFYVNSATDTAASDCTTPSNTDCGIDDAITAFNADVTTLDADTIVFKSSISTFTVGTPTPINNATSGINLAIVGNGQSHTAVSGGNTHTVFVLSTGSVNISGLTVEDGHATSATGSFGGGIYSNGTTTVTNSTISGSSGTEGGGIYVSTGTVNVTDSTISGNTATSGGGIYVSTGTVPVTDSTISGNSGNGIFNNNGTVTVTDSTISGNSYTGGWGGGIRNNNDATVTQSTISGNSALLGAGIFNNNDTIVSDSTISGNTAVDNGGGFYNQGGATITHSTISGNSAPSTSGGGIYNPDPLDLVATIVANNGTGKDCKTFSTDLTDGGYNLDDDGSCGFLSANHSMSNTSAGLNTAGLENNGGPTQSIALESGSAAIDEVTLAADCTGSDQTGAPWPTPCDIGAVQTFDWSASLAWSSPALIDESVLNSVSCVSSTFCMAVDDFGRALIYNGTAWSSPMSIGDGTAIVSSVSCVSTTFCMAVDHNGYALSYNGATWSSPTLIDPTSLTSVSCVSSTFCMAVDVDGYVENFDGVTWSTALNIDTGLTSVSCVSTTFCMAVDSGGDVLTYSGTAWSLPGPALVADESSINSVSCVSSTFCMAVDLAGDALNYVGTSWSAPPTIDTHGLSSVSCLSNTFCIAVGGDTAGDALSYNGTAWSSLRSIDSSTYLTSVSCVSGGFCMAVDSDGDALNYAPQATATKLVITGNTCGSDLASGTDCTLIATLEDASSNPVVDGSAVTFAHGVSNTGAVTGLSSVTNNLTAPTPSRLLASSSARSQLPRLTRPTPSRLRTTRPPLRCRLWPARRASATLPQRAKRSVVASRPPSPRPATASRRSLRTTPQSAPRAL